MKVRHLAIDLPNGCSYGIGIAHGTLLNTLAWASSDQWETVSTCHQPSDQ